MLTLRCVGLFRPLCLALLCAGITTQALADDTIVPGPPKPGTVTYTVTLANGTVVTVPVTITTETTKGEKALTIATTMQGAPYNLSASVTAAENVSIASAVTITSNNATHEADTFAALQGPGFGSYHVIGALSPVGTDGNSSQYFVSFGFDGQTYSTDVLYSDLSSPTIDQLMTMTYDNLLTALPASRDGDLSLNLMTDSITFDFLPTDTNISIQSFSTDAGVTVQQTLGATPEPAGLALLGTGLLAGIGAVRRKFHGVASK